MCCRERMRDTPLLRFDVYQESGSEIGRAADPVDDGSRARLARTVFSEIELVQSKSDKWRERKLEIEGRRRLSRQRRADVVGSGVEPWRRRSYSAGCSRSFMGALTLAFPPG